MPRSVRLLLVGLLTLLFAALAGPAGAKTTTKTMTLKAVSSRAAATSAVATTGVDKLKALLPGWCTGDPAAGQLTRYGSRTDACDLGLATFQMPAPDPTITLYVAILSHSDIGSGKVVYRYFAAVQDMVAPDPDSYLWPILISADIPGCGSSCTTDRPTGFDSAYLTVPYDKVAEFDFTVTQTVPSGGIANTAPKLKLGVGQDVGFSGYDWYVQGDVPGPAARCDRVVAGTGCVFASVVPTWYMDWRPSGVLNSNAGFPQVAAHIRDAQNIMGTQNQILHRTDTTTKLKNRAAACGKVSSLTPTYDDTTAVLLPGTYSCDEYPMASTDEGGQSTAVGSPYPTGSYVASGAVPMLSASSKLSIAPLINSQNRQHGSALSTFYADYRILPRRGTTTQGDGFRVGFAAAPPTYTPPTYRPEPTDLSCKATGTASAAALRAVANACAKVGNTSYTYGGGHGPYAGPSYGYYDGSDPASLNDGSVWGFDCSGFVRWVWFLATGQDFLDGSSQMQRNKLAATPSLGTAVSRTSLAPGDVIFFGGAGRVHHVALYIGDNKIVEARQSGTKVMVSSLSSHDDYYEAYRPLASGAAVSDPGGNEYVWATNVNVRATPSTSATKLSTIPGMQSITVKCQAPGEAVTVGTASSTYWSNVPALGNGWISNVFIRGGAVLDGIPACSGSTLPPTSSGGKWQVWASNVNVRSTPAATGTLVGTIASPTGVNVTCQAVGATVTDGGYTSSYWSKISSPAGYISNVYIKGPDKLDGVPMCSGDSTPPTRNVYFQTWAMSVNIRSAANTTASVVGTITNPSTIDVVCQLAGTSVTDGGYTSNYWSRLAYPAVGYISNVYIKGPAQLPGVPIC